MLLTEPDFFHTIIGFTEILFAYVCIFFIFYF